VATERRPRNVKKRRQNGAVRNRGGAVCVCQVRGHVKMIHRCPALESQSTSRRVVCACAGSGSFSRCSGKCLPNMPDSVVAYNPIQVPPNPRNASLPSHRAMNYGYNSRAVLACLSNMGTLARWSGKVGIRYSVHRSRVCNEMQRRR